MKKVEIFKDRKKQWRFRCKANNGKIVAQSEGYTTKRNCLRGVMALQSIMDGGLLVEV